MSGWFKILGGVAGMALGGPFGAVVGAALGHAAENGGVGKSALPGGGAEAFPGFGPARLGGLFGSRDQVLAVCSTVLAAKLAKSDGPVNRAEIDAFKRHFRTPPEGAREVGRLFDQARETAEGYQSYAAQLGDAFADSPEMLETLLGLLFAVARADGPISTPEQTFLQAVCVRFGLDQTAWDRVSGGQQRRSPPPASRSERDEAYTLLGLTRSASDEELHAQWKRLVRQNHPDRLASEGRSAEAVARAGERVARINAAWDTIKRERRLSGI